MNEEDDQWNRLKAAHERMLRESEDPHAIDRVEREMGALADIEYASPIPDAILPCPHKPAPCFIGSGSTSFLIYRAERPRWDGHPDTESWHAEHQVVVTCEGFRGSLATCTQGDYSKHRLFGRGIWSARVFLVRNSRWLDKLQKGEPRSLQHFLFLFDLVDFDIVARECWFETYQCGRNELPQLGGDFNRGVPGWKASTDVARQQILPFMSNPYKKGDKVITKYKGSPMEVEVIQVWNEEVQVRTADGMLRWRTVKTVKAVDAASAPVPTAPTPSAPVMVTTTPADLEKVTPPAPVAPVTPAPAPAARTEPPPAEKPKKEAKPKGKKANGENGKKHKAAGPARKSR